MHKWIVWTLTSITGVLILHTVFSIYFYRYHQEPPVTYSNVVLQQGDIIQQGDVVSFSVERCAKANYRAIVYRSFEDTILWEFAPLTDQAIQKGCVVTVREMRVPNSITPGVYMLKGETVINIDWLYFHKTRVVHFETKSFTVVR